MLRHRLRTFTLWTGTLLSLLIVAAFVVSAWWLLWIGVPGGPFINVHSGAIGFYLITDATWAGYMSYDSGQWLLLVGRTDANGFLLPLIYPFAAVALPTLLVWRLWSKPIKPGHCRCGYDLTGNTSGVCPECGQPFEPKGDAP